MSERILTGKMRSLIYSRWFYAFLAAVCLLDAVVDVIDIIRPGESFTLDLISVMSSIIAAVMTGLVFLDLHLRRAKP